METQLQGVVKAVQLHGLLTAWLEVQRDIAEVYIVMSELLHLVTNTESKKSQHPAGAEPSSDLEKRGLPSRTLPYNSLVRNKSHLQKPPKTS